MNILLFRLTFPVAGAAVYVALGWLFMRSFTEELSRFQKVVVFYGCVFCLGTGYIAMFAEYILHLTGSDIPLILLCMCWLSSFGWIVWRRHLK